MKLFINIVFLFYTTTCLAQRDTTVLFIPIRTDQITFDKHVERVFLHNKISVDSVKTFIQQSTFDRLETSFPKFSFINLQSINDYKFLIDSLSTTQTWTSQQVQKINSSLGFKKIMASNDESSKYKYYGRVMRDDYSLILKALIINHDLKYIFCINKFEIFTPCFLTNKTRFCFHIDIYDSSLNKIYGGKSYWVAKTTDNMYYSAFSLYLFKAMDSIFRQAKEFIYKTKK